MSIQIIPFVIYFNNVKSKKALLQQQHIVSFFGRINFI